MDHPVQVTWVNELADRQVDHLRTRRSRSSRSATRSRTLVGERVWVRFHGDKLIVAAMVAGSAAEVTRHLRSTPGSPRIADGHYPDAPRGERTPKPTNPADAVALAKLYGTADVDRALGTAATAGRFAEGDLLSILDHQSEHDRVEPIRGGETHTLQPGTSASSSSQLSRNQTTSTTNPARTDTKGSVSVIRATYRTPRQQLRPSADTASRVGPDLERAPAS